MLANSPPSHDVQGDFNCRGTQFSCAFADRHDAATRGSSLVRALEISKRLCMTQIFENSPESASSHVNWEGKRSLIRTSHLWAPNESESAKAVICSLREREKGI